MYYLVRKWKIKNEDMLPCHFTSYLQGQQWWSVTSRLAIENNKREILYFFFHLVHSWTYSYSNSCFFMCMYKATN